MHAFEIDFLFYFLEEYEAAFEMIKKGSHLHKLNKKGKLYRRWFAIDSLSKSLNYRPSKKTFIPKASPNCESLI